jgi:hypothetical protein
MKDAKGHGSNGKGGYWDAAAATAKGVADATAKFGSAPAKVWGSDGRSSNAQAAQSLMAGLKSTMVPVHDSMSGQTDAAGIKDHVYNMLKGFGPRPDTSKF